MAQHLIEIFLFKGKDYFSFWKLFEFTVSSCFFLIFTGKCTYKETCIFIQRRVR